MPTVKTTCALDCQDACGIEAEVKDGRILRLRGSRETPYTEGFLCIRLNRFLDRLYSQERVTRPLRRTPSGWEELSWEEAISLAAGKIQEACHDYGPLSILYYLDVGSFGISKQYSVRLFNLLGGPTLASGNLCLAAGTYGFKKSLGSLAVHEPSDMLNSRMIVLWGKNPVGYGVHIVPLLRKARERGCEVVLIDPIQSESAKLCDRIYQPRPGGDGHLALAICKYLLEEGGADQGFLRDHTANFPAFRRLVDSFSWEELSRGSDLSIEVLREIAGLFQTRKPATILMGKGPQHYHLGVEISRLILAVGAVAGNIGVPGGGVNFSGESFGVFDLSLRGEEFVRHRRTAPKAILGDVLPSLDDPPIRVAWINGGNPVAQCPNSRKVEAALRAVDFVMVVDPFLTDTAECAHLFLPCALFLEDRDVRASGWHPYVGPIRPVVKPPDGAKTDWEILGLLARRLGLEDPFLGHPVERVLRAACRPFAEHGVSLDEAVEEVFRRPDAEEVPYRGGSFDTPSGKFEFLEVFRPHPPFDADYPLHLLSLKNPKFQASQALLAQQNGLPGARLHPETAAALGLEEGDEADLLSPRGRYRVQIHLDEGLRQDVCVTRSGGWVKKGQGINVLTADVMSTGGECPGYYETRVRVVAARA